MKVLHNIDKEKRNMLLGVIVAAVSAIAYILYRENVVTQIDQNLTEEFDPIMAMENQQDTVVEHSKLDRIEDNELKTQSATTPDRAFFSSGYHDIKDHQDSISTQQQSYNHIKTPSFTPPDLTSFSSAAEKQEVKSYREENLYKGVDMTVRDYGNSKQKNTTPPKNKDLSKKIDTVIIEKEPEVVLTKEELLTQQLREKYYGNQNDVETMAIEARAEVFEKETIYGTQGSFLITLQDPIKLNQGTIGTKGVIVAHGELTREGLLKVTLHDPQYKGKTFKGLTLYGYDAQTKEKGIRLKSRNFLKNAQKVGQREVEREVRDYGRIGNIIADIFSGKNKEVEFFIDEGTPLILKNY